MPSAITSSGSDSPLAGHPVKPSYSSDEHPNKSGESYIERGKAQIKEIVEDREGRTVLTALVAGLGLGLLVGSALRGSRSSKWSDRTAAEGIGRRLMESVDSYLPDALAERFGR